MTTTSKLHLPDAPARPGEQPDFSRWTLTPPGKMGRPPIDTQAHDMDEHAYHLVRVMDDKGAALGEWADAALSVDTLKASLRLMAKTRVFDNKMFRAQRQGKMSFYVKSTGEEAVSVAQALAFADDDMMFPTYRQTGLWLARGVEMEEMMCQLLSNAADPCKGRQLPVMYSSVDKKIFSVSGNLGTQYPQAVGYAMAEAYKGSDNLAAVWCGDGTTAEGDFYYGLNFAGVYKPPCILNVTNNQWAISTPQTVAGFEEQHTFASRAVGFGIPGLIVDGNDFLAVYAVTKWAVERARAGHGATLIELFTYRAEGHSTSDDPSAYRPKNEFDAWPLGDPIERLKKHLIAMGEWSDDEDQRMWSEIEAEVDATWKSAMAKGDMESGPRPSAAEMFRDVFAIPPAHLKSQYQQFIEEHGADEFEPGEATDLLGESL